MMRFFVRSAVFVLWVVVVESAVIEDDPVKNTSENAVFCRFYDPSCAKVIQILKTLVL